MAPRKVVPLSRVYDETGKPIQEIAFRAPRWPDYMAIGQIAEWQQMQGGAPVLIRYVEKIGEYAERLIDPPEAIVTLTALDLVDSLAVEDAIADFFREARAAQTKSDGSPINSSGDSDGDPATSRN